MEMQQDVLKEFLKVAFDTGFMAGKSNDDDYTFKEFLKNCENKALKSGSKMGAIYNALMESESEEI